MAFATEENSRGSPDEIDSNTDDTIVRWQLNSLNCFKPVGKTNVLFPHCNLAMHVTTVTHSFNFIHNKYTCGKYFYKLPAPAQKLKVEN